MDLIVTSHDSVRVKLELHSNTKYYKEDDTIFLEPEKKRLTIGLKGYSKTDQNGINRQKYITQMPIPSAVSLTHDRTNKFDSNAIVIRNWAEQDIGFIPFAYNRQIIDYFTAFDLSKSACLQQVKATINKCRFVYNKFYQPVIIIDLQPVVKPNYVGRLPYLSLND